MDKLKDYLDSLDWENVVRIWRADELPDAFPWIEGAEGRYRVMVTRSCDMTGFARLPYADLSFGDYDIVVDST